MAKDVKKGKKPHKSKPTSKKYAKYKVEGNEIKRTEGFCPRCGPGIFLMNSQGRLYCGKCHYSEFKSKEEKSKDEKSKDEKSDKKEKDDSKK